MSASLEETDMGSYFTFSDILPQPAAAVFYPAMAMGPWQRQVLALHAPAGTTPISRLAAEYEVSQKFIYRQRTRATDPTCTGQANALDVKSESLEC
jgi:hypothetical protein